MKKVLNTFGLTIVAVILFAIHCYGFDRAASGVWDLTDSQLTVIIICGLMSAAAAICSAIYLLFLLFHNLYRFIVN